MVSQKKSNWACAAAVLGALVIGDCPLAKATTVFQEDFSGATPGEGYTGAIPGTKFTVTGGNVDVLGVLHGSFYGCGANPSGNCLDLIGNEGYGQIESTTIGLVEGDTYTISYSAVLQGYSGTTPTENYSVSLGDETVIETVDPTVNPVSISFTADSTQPGASLEFTSITNLDGDHGPVLSDITVTGAASGVPEPSTWAMMLLGFAGLGFAGYRRARVKTYSAISSA